ncbi:MAG: MFS transporter [Streptosporangiales bacterium]|nr:MFS transporter [Streptosporangiales bacterium]MBO0889730.1 MFS transporter [Acidothermales bacterium]
MTSTTGTFRSLRIRNYRLYWFGGAVSNIGTWMQRIAQDWLVLHLSHNSGFALGVTTGLQFLPMLLFGLWGGVLADRYDKRKLLQLTQLSFAAVGAMLAVLDLGGVVQVWHVYLLALLLGVVTAVDNPARQSFVVEMVGSRDVSNAVALNSASFNTARIVGPAVAGLLINLIGTGPVFVVNAVSYAAVLVGLRLMRADELRQPDRAQRARGQLREGLRYVKDRPDLLLPMIIVGFVGTFGLNFQITMALMAKEVFHRGAGSFGLLATAMAVGSLTGALLAARRSRPRARLFVEAAVAFGVLEIVSGLLPTYETFMAVLVPIGVFSISMATTANAYVQISSSPSMRGRVMALYALVFMGGTPIGAPIVGWAAGQFGAQWSLVIGGAVSLLATVVATALLSRRQGLRLQPRVRPLPHWDVSFPETPTGAERHERMDPEVADVRRAKEPVSG